MPVEKGEGYEDTSFYNLLISSDPEVLAGVQKQLEELTAQGMSFNDAMSQIAKTSQEATDQLAQMGAQSAESVTGTSTAVQGLNQQLQDTQTQTERVNDLLAQMREQAAEAAAAIPEPPPFPGLEDAGGGGGGRGGSLFGIGHALSVAGHSLGSPALREAGGFVYIEEGLKRALPLMQQFGQAAADSSPGLTNLVAGATGLGTPMAGLLAVVGPLAIAVGGLVIGLKAYNDGIEAGAKLLTALIKGQDEYFDFIKTATTEDAKQKVQSLEDSNVTAKKKLDDNVNIIKSYIQQIGAPEVLGTGKEFLENVQKTGALSGAEKPILDAFDAAQKYADEIEKNDLIVGRLTGDIQNNSLAANDAAEATKKATQAAIEKANGDAAIQRQLISDLALSPDQAKKRLDYLQQEGPIIQGQIEALRPFIGTSEEAKKQFDDLNKQLQDNVAEMEFLTNTAIPAAQGVKDLADNLKAADDALKQANQAHDTYVKAVSDAELQLSQQKEDALNKEKQQEAELSAGSIQDTYQRSQIVLDEQRKEKALIQDTANAIADVRTKLGQKEVADLTDYNRKLMDDQTKYQQDVQKDRMGAYRQERDDLQSHLEKLADIQNKQSVDQQDALLNRNFLALAKVQQGHQSEIDAENTAYARKQARNEQHLQDELTDLAIHQAEIRTQQFVEYQRKLADDRLHAQQEIDQKNVLENRKLQDLRLHEQQQLIDLTTTENYKIQILRQGFAQELALYELQNQRRLQAAQQAEQQFWATSFKQNPVATVAAASGQALGGVASQVGGFVDLLFGKKKTFDQGGSFGAGEMFMKGDIPEMFNFGGAGSYSIPGAAMVMPLQSGTATPGAGGGNTFNFNIPITGGNKEEMARQASAAVYKRIMETFTE